MSSKIKAMKRFIQFVILLILSTVLAFCLSAASAEKKIDGNKFIKAVHLMAPQPSGLNDVAEAITNVFAKHGVKMLIFEIDYRLKWDSHPELRGDNPLSKEQLKWLSKLCSDNNIKLVPLFNCLGHQSWKSYNSPLLTKYPQFDETPNLPKDNPGIYCRSWCPSNSDLMPIISDLFKELIEATGSDILHVGMDEVFIIANDDCPRCKGKNPADLFAKAVNDIHSALSKLNVKMIMWGDRLLDDSVMKYGKWEASQNGTAPAIDKIPKDIIICDWHYEPRKEYPSVKYFIEKGFKVFPSSWKNEKAALTFLEYSSQWKSNPGLAGHLCTTWCDSAALARELLKKSKQSAQVEEIAKTTITVLSAIKE